MLTAFLALDTFVELYDGGTIRLSEFVNRKPDKDILLSIIVRKVRENSAMIPFDRRRRTSGDRCSVVTGLVHGKETWYFSVGARPMKAALLEKQWEIPADASEEMIADYARQAASEFTYGSNMRGSAEYRQHLAEVLIRREMTSILAEGDRMEIQFTLNKKQVTAEVGADTVLLGVLRDLGCKRCEMRM